MRLWSNVEVETAFGAPIDPDRIDQESIRRMVEAGQREGQHLEFKEGPYLGENPNWRWEQEFAKDVSAMANGFGGVIVVGVADTDDVATGDPGLSDDPAAEQERLRRALVSYTSPPLQVPMFAVAKDDGRHHLVAVVPPSPQAPHAVPGKRGDSRQPLHYFIRNGTEVRPLGPTEVAERHLARGARAGLASERLAQVAARGLEQLGRSAGLWTYVAVSPMSPVPGAVDREAVAHARTWMSENGSFPLPGGSRSLYVQTHQPVTAPGRVCFMDSSAAPDGSAPDPGFSYVELGVDGSAFAARSDPEDPREPDWSVRVVNLAMDALLLVDATSKWAANRAGTFGTVDVTIGIAEPSAPPGVLARPLRLQQAREGSSRPWRIPNTRDVHQSPSATVTIDLADAATYQGTVAATHMVLSALLTWFGLVEPDQFGPDGTIYTYTWGTSLSPRDVQSWAQGLGLPTEANPPLG